MMVMMVATTVQARDTAAESVAAEVQLWNHIALATTTKTARTTTTTTLTPTDQEGQPAQPDGPIMPVMTSGIKLKWKGATSALTEEGGKVVTGAL